MSIQKVVLIRQSEKKCCKVDFLLLRGMCTDSQPGGPMAPFSEILESAAHNLAMAAKLLPVLQDNHF